MQADEKNPSIKHLAHDLNNIFTRILNSLELLKRKIPHTEDVTSLLNNIEAGTYLASEIIEDAITNSSNTRLTRRVNINSIINDVVRSFSFQVKNKIKFELDLDLQLKLTSGKYSDLYRIVLNLVNNSVEAIESNGVIKLTTKNLDNGKIAFIICDNGVGIDDTNLPHIFDEHFTTKSKQNISGIGLYVVKQIIENYNGSIAVESMPAKGTTFKIEFFAAVAKETDLSNKEKHILIAEDEDVLRELLAELLQSFNYKVATAINGKDVLRLVEENNFDLLIIDRKMPIMDGLHCIRELRINHSTIPIILASGSHTEDKEIQASLHIEKILNKPYNFEEMISVVNELIG